MRRAFSTKTSAAGLSIASNTLLILLKIVVGILTGSVSILSEAIHSLLDLFAAVIAFFSVRAAAKPADVQHPFGHGKLENLSGGIEAGLIFVAAGLIIYGAINRMIKGAGLELVELGIGVMLVSVVVNVFVSRHLLKISRTEDSIALEADARHLTADVYTSLGVLVGLVIVRLTGWNILDPIIAIGVALLILKTAYDLIKKSSVGLLDVKLPPAEEAEVQASITQHCGELVGFHSLRTRKSGGERYIDLHLVMAKDASLDRAHKMCDHLEEDIKSKLPHTSVTIHVEPCDNRCERCPASPCPEVKKKTFSFGGKG